MCIAILSLFLLQEERMGVGWAEEGHLPFLPIDFPVPVSGSLVSPNYSSVFSSSLGWDISHGGGLTVPQSARGGLGR